MKSLIKRCDNLFALSLNKYVLFLTNALKRKVNHYISRKFLQQCCENRKKKNYLKFLTYKLIALLNTLNKMLKSIIFKRIQYVVKILKTFLNI